MKRFYKDDGSSLIEVIIAFLILGIIMTATIQTSVQSLQSTNRSHSGLIMATVAERELELLRSLPVNTWAINPNLPVTDEKRFEDKIKTYLVQGPKDTEYQATLKTSWHSTNGSRLEDVDLCNPGSSAGPTETKDYVVAQISIKALDRRDGNTYTTSTIVAPRNLGYNPKYGALFIQLYDSEEDQGADKRISGADSTLDIKLYEPVKNIAFAGKQEFEKTPIKTATSSNGCFHFRNLEYDQLKIVISNANRHWMEKDSSVIEDIVPLANGITTNRQYIYPRFMTLQVRPFLNATYANKFIGTKKISCTYSKDPSKVGDTLVLDQSADSPRRKAGNYQHLAPPPQNQWKLQCGEVGDFYIPNFIDLRLRNPNEPNGIVKFTVNADDPTGKDADGNPKPQPALRQWDIKVAADGAGHDIDLYFGQCGEFAKWGFVSNADATAYAQGDTTSLKKASGTTVPFEAGQTREVFVPLYPVVLNGWAGTDVEPNAYYEPVMFMKDFRSSCKDDMQPVDVGQLQAQVERQPDGRYGLKEPVNPVQVAQVIGWNRVRFGEYVGITNVSTSDQLCAGVLPDPAPGGDDYKTTTRDGLCVRVPELANIRWNKQNTKLMGYWVSR